MLEHAILPLIGNNATIRPMRHSDAAAYAAGTADAAVRRWGHLPEPEYSPESVAALIDGPIRDGSERGTLAVLTIADPATDAFAGSLVLFDVTEKSAELGFWLLPEHRGTGRGRAAIALAIEFARRSGLGRLTAQTALDNAASQHTLTRAGFIATGAAKDFTPAGQEIELQSFELSIPPAQSAVLTTGRLRLRLHERGDEAKLQRIYATPDVARYLLDEPWTAEDASRNLSRRLPQIGLDSPDHALALVLEHGGTVIGDVQLWLTDAERRVAEIGWVLDPAASGRGFATEAVSAVLDHAFARGRVHRVAAQLDPRNEASGRLAERVGMRHEAHLRQNWWSKGEWTDTAIYGMLATDR